MATNSPISNLPSGKMRHSTDSDGTKAQKRPASNQAISEVGEHAGNKMPKVSLKSLFIFIPKKYNKFTEPS
jgi:hypothetical protein